MKIMCRPGIPTLEEDDFLPLIQVCNGQVLLEPARNCVVLTPPHVVMLACDFTYSKLGLKVT